MQVYGVIQINNHNGTIPIQRYDWREKGEKRCHRRLVSAGETDTKPKQRPLFSEQDTPILQEYDNYFLV